MPKIVRLALPLALVWARLAPAAHAVEPLRAELTCPAPISTCETKPDGEGACPSGYRCACVPSCPTCRDCAAQVCVPDLSRQCRTACDCPPGLACTDGRCIAGIAPVFCCESDRCPLGQQCQHGDGRPDRCGQECQTACDCEAGLSCVDGQCIAGFAPVFCCDGDQCPAGQQCQHRDGGHDRCGQACSDQLWRCEAPGNECGPDRVCACSASCPDCEDCGPAVCVVRGTPTPYRCSADGSCSRPGDRCVCVASCPACDDCAMNACVPSCDPMCDRRLRISTKRIDRIAQLTRQCHADDDCVRADTSTDCGTGCGAWVNRRYADRLGRMIDYIDQRYCATYRADGCSPIERPCATARSACVNGLCTGVPATP